MATVIIPFVPSLIQAPEFQVTLDGQIYNCIVTWNLAAQRFYLNIYQLNGERVLTVAMVGSPVGVPIAAMSWKNGKVTVTTGKPHTLKYLATMRITITNVVPVAYNGEFEIFVTGTDTFTFLLDANPGEMVTPGSANQNIDLVSGLFNSVMVFRAANSQFEVTQ